MAKKKTAQHFALGAGVVALVGLVSLGFYQVKSSLDQTALVQSEIAQSLLQLKSDLGEVQKQQTALASPEHFKSAVINAIESYGQQQQAQVAAKKLETYSAAAEKLAEGRYVYGSMSAQFTLVEFSDLECPYCKRFHQTAKEVVDKSNGLINWEWKHMPLGFHQPAAGIEAHAAECIGDLAGNRAFWVYLDDIFAVSKGNGQGTNELMRLAVDLGVDAEAFKACMSSGKFQKKIENDQAMGASLGVTGTPTSFLIDNTTGKRLTLGGAQPTSAVLSAVRSLQQARSENSTELQGADSQTGEEAK